MILPKRIPTFGIVPGGRGATTPSLNGTLLEGTTEDRIDSMKSALSGINHATIISAGVRYTPAVDASAPNLVIESSVELIDALSLNDTYRKRLNEMAAWINGAADRYSNSLVNGFHRRKQTPNDLARLLRKLADQKPGTSKKTTNAIVRTLRYCRKRTSEIERELLRKEREAKEHSNEPQRISAEQLDVRKLSGVLYEIVEFVDSKAFQCVTNNKLLFLGEWGTGKTHFLCDITQLRENQKLPTLTVLANKLSRIPNPLEAVCELVPTVSNTNQLLVNLDRMGEKLNGRALIIIDGINEADINAWSYAIPQIAQKLEQYDHVGLVLSCRTPYDRKIFSDKNRKKFVPYNHQGFNEIEIDAQSEFFGHYEIPPPNVPLLVDEFSRPLFLKILCETLQTFADSTKRKKISDIASGHRSMTTIFEDFIKQVGKGIEKDFGLPGRTCWKILKGNRINGSAEIVGVAAEMAESQSDFLARAKVIQIICAHTGPLSDDGEALLERMVIDGLIAEDMVWEGGEWIDAIRMPYQRFSDHLISRHLLDRYLKTDSPEAIKRSFHVNRPLGKIFELENGGFDYRQPGIASALMLEFPERIKRVVPTDKRELIVYLPKARRNIIPFVDAFLDGLVWRDKESFSDETHYLISFLLKHGSDNAKRKTLDTLVCLATRSAHSDTAVRLEKCLDRLDLTKRDLLWSEFLRKSDASETPHRVLRWVEKNRGINASEAENRALISVLEWFLTTTNRGLRDRATRALVFIGESSPETLFDRTLASLSRNDPYIPERMLAASYGVLMRNWWGAKPAFTASAGEFARSIFDLMFERRGAFRTKHLLARDYALGVIHLSMKMSPRCLGSRDQTLLQAPFSTFRGKIPLASKIKVEECEGADTAIHMDFGNYTIGRLVEDPASYDCKRGDYKNIRRQIEWRINDLGYSEELFKEIDRQIANDNFSMGRSDMPGKIDRYGKKYSWIAFYEVAGLVQDRNLIGPVFDHARMSDTDIDPSFPDSEIEFSPPLKSLFPKKQSPEEWIEGGIRPRYRSLLEQDMIDSHNGPWVLLDGFLEEDSKIDDRQAFTFLRGVFVAKNEIGKLVRAFRVIDYPGNNAIPEPGGDYYTFAGEIAWSGRYANTLFDPSRSTWTQQVDTAFSLPKTRKIRKQFCDLDVFEFVQLRGSMAPIVGMNGLEVEQDQEPMPSPQEIVEVDQHYSTLGIEVEIPVWSNNWESYHSVVNQGGGFKYPAPTICDHAGLNSIHGQADLVDHNGAVGSVFRVLPKSWEHARGHLLYLRKDLLEQYLDHTNQNLVWLMWGERRMHYGSFEEYEKNRGRFENLRSEYKHIHRSTKKFLRNRSK